MHRMAGADEFYALINNAKVRCGRLDNNCQLFPEAVNRLISLERFYAEETDAGVSFFSDEESYYLAYLYIAQDKPLLCAPKDKPVLAQTVFRGEKKPSIQRMEEKLADRGFLLDKTARHGEFIGYEGIPKIQRTRRGIQRIFDQEGLSISPVRRDQFSAVEAFRKTIPELSFYEFPFFSEDELAEEASQGRFLCVTNRDGRIIAARHLILNGKKAYGWVGVEDDYKTLYGVALMFLCHALDYIQEHDIRMCSWVDETNTASLEYHERLGTAWNGQKMDEWILKKEA